MGKPIWGEVTVYCEGDELDVEIVYEATSLREAQAFVQQVFREGACRVTVLDVDTEDSDEFEQVVWYPPCRIRSAGYLQRKGEA